MSKNLLCYECGKKLIEDYRVEEEECINVGFKCVDHGLQFIVSKSKRVYTRSGSYIDNNIKFDESDKIEE